MADTVKALLIRLPAGAAPQALGLAAGVALEPLFTTAEPASPGLGVAAGPRQWHIARPRGSTAGANAWDLAHDTLARLATGPGIAAAPDLIEPDLVQDWLHDQPQTRPALAASAGCSFDDQDQALPSRPGEFAWHLADAFAQLGAARTEAEQHEAVVRIAHLDTGYDPDHVTFPASRIEKLLQRNFVDETKDATDLGVEGILKNPGHGTGTLSILAGGAFQFGQAGYQFGGLLGGTSQARIVPVRVGNSVVQIRTSDVARGINYAAELCADPETAVHVISMSMGGVASAAWADAVNKAYSAGIVFVAAA